MADLVDWRLSIEIVDWSIEIVDCGLVRDFAIACRLLGSQGDDRIDTRGAADRQV